MPKHGTLLFFKLLRLDRNATGILMLVFPAGLRAEAHINPELREDVGAPVFP